VRPRAPAKPRRSPAPRKRAPARAPGAIDNAEVADAFDAVADLLEIAGDNPFRIRAYRNAARTLRALPDPLRERIAAGRDLTEIPGIGADLAGKIAELVHTGRLGLLDELSRNAAPGLPELLRLRGIGPKRVHALHEELGVASVDDLERAARSGRIRELRGFGEKTEAEVLRSIEHLRGEGARVPWARAEPVALALLEHLRQSPAALRAEVAGSFRRRKDTVGDLDLLVATRDPRAAGERFVAFPQVARVLAHGPTRAAVVLRSGLQVDLRAVAPESFGSALHYFTGSKAHDIAVRKLGLERGLKVNEYGVFRGARRIAGRTEEEVYAAVGLPYVEPELREGRGELEAARDGRLPALIELDDLRGDLHAHTTASDGRNSIEEMARAAKRLGREYLGIADHTRAARIAHGLGPARLAKHLEEIERARGRVGGIRLLASAEVDVLPDGALDLPDAVLAKLDVVTCAVHSGFALGEAAQTGRILRAIEHARCHVLGHPTGRLLGVRPAYRVDLHRVLAAAKEHGVALELNSQPERLDLDDVWCRAAKELGVAIVISSDAHSVDELAFLRYGVFQARRGWLERRDVLNALPWPQLRSKLRR
jgi:DNA polymerase (family 10)